MLLLNIAENRSEQIIGVVENIILCRLIVFKDSNQKNALDKPLRNPCFFLVFSFLSFCCLWFVSLTYSVYQNLVTKDLCSLVPCAAQPITISFQKIWKYPSCSKLSYLLCDSLTFETRKTKKKTTGTHQPKNAETWISYQLSQLHSFAKQEDVGVSILFLLWTPNITTPWKKTKESVRNSLTIQVKWFAILVLCIPMVGGHFGLSHTYKWTGFLHLKYLRWDSKLTFAPSTYHHDVIQDTYWNAISVSNGHFLMHWLLGTPERLF